MNETNVIGEVKKNSLEKIVVSANVFNGKPYIDARIWWRKVATDTKWLPSKKGFCISLESTDELTELLAQGTKLRDAS